MKVASQVSLRAAELFRQRLHAGELSELLRLSAFAWVYALAYRYGMAFSQNSASPFWFPDSALLCALLLVPQQRWAFYVLLTLPIRVFSEASNAVPPWFLGLAFTIDAVKGVLTAAALRRWVPGPLRFGSIRQFSMFALIAALLVPALGAFAGAGARNLLGHPYWASWDQWFMGNGLSQLIITPAVLCLAFAERPWPRWSKRRVFEVCTVGIVLAVTSRLAANTGEGTIDLLQARFYAPVPFMFWAAVRFGMPGAAGAIAISAYYVTQAAIAGHGPFAGLSPDETAASLQNFLLLRAAPLYLIAIGVEQNRSVERRLRESDERFRAMADGAPVLIFYSGPDNRIEFFNQRWLEFTGRPLDEERGEGWTAGVHPDDLPNLLAAQRRCFAARRPFELEYRLRRKDGEYRWMVSLGIPRSGPRGEFLGYVGSAMDISDRKRVEEATRALTHSQRLASMGELTALIAHEVRQPLCAMLVNTDTLDRLVRGDELALPLIQGIISRIREDILRADGTISRVRTFVRQRELDHRAVDLNEVVSDVLRFVASEARRRGVQLYSRVALDLPAVRGDAAHLQQVLVNLIVNAMDASSDQPEGERVVRICTQALEGGRVEVSVRDRGRGIEPDALPRLFDPFFTTGKDGVGLGLSVAHTIVIAHRGRIWAENNPDGGATLRVAIPVAESDGPIHA
jgi:PAS domain S-box-containing protein